MCYGFLLILVHGKPARLAWARDGGQVEIKRKVKDFDEDLSRFQRDQKSLFEGPKLLPFF